MDELRRAIARERLAGGVLAAMAAEKAARAGLFEEGIGEQLRLRRRLLADRARYPAKITRAEDKAGRIRAERDAAKAAAGRRREGGRGKGRGAGLGRPRPQPPPPPPLHDPADLGHYGLALGPPARYARRQVGPPLHGPAPALDLAEYPAHQDYEAEGPLGPVVGRLDPLVLKERKQGPLVPA